MYYNMIQLKHTKYVFLNKLKLIYYIYIIKKLQFYRNINEIFIDPFVVFNSRNIIL